MLALVELSKEKNMQTRIPKIKSFANIVSRFQENYCFLISFLMCLFVSYACSLEHVFSACTIFGTNCKCLHRLAWHLLPAGEPNQHVL